MDYSNIYQQLIKKFPQTEIFKDHPLAPYTTLKIGGPADIFIHTKTSEEFFKILKFIGEAKGLSTKNNLASQFITILGNGSNVLISDAGIRGIVIKNSAQEIEILPDNKVKVSSGTQLPYLINYTLDHNLLGLQEFAYIPSTIGGAIAGNIHGIRGHISDYIDSIENYNSFITSAVLKLTPGDPTQAKIEAQETIRKKSLVQSMNSVGSVFKNLPADQEGPVPAGFIIDQKLGLKGKTIGGAQISPLHANFIINIGNTTAADYLSLIKFIQSEALNKLGIKLELEIKLLGEFN